jgi:hypothetical protein
MGQQIHRAWQRANLIRQAQVNVFVQALNPHYGVGAQFLPSLSQQGVYEKPTAHSYPAVDAPDR